MFVAADDGAIELDGDDPAIDPEVIEQVAHAERARQVAALAVQENLHRRYVFLGVSLIDSRGGRSLSLLDLPEHKLRLRPIVDGFLPVLIMIGLGLGFAAGSVVLSLFVGPRKPTPEKLAPYECGMPAVGDARERQSVKFYLVAMIFLLFDIEVAFLYPWALAFRDLGMLGFVQVVTFFALLTTGYVYVWRKGVFDWSGERRR